MFSRLRFLIGALVSTVGSPLVTCGKPCSSSTLPAFGLIAVFTLATGVAGAADDGPSLAPYLTPATASPKSPNAEGFLQRWLLLEPIKKPFRNSNAGFSEPFVRNAITNEYVPDQFTLVPRDGDKATVAGNELAWHALDATGYNVKLFRFADNL